MANDQQPHPVNFREVADRILSNVKLFVMEDDSTFYVYKNGVYTADGAEAMLNREVRRVSDDMNMFRGAPLVPADRKFIAEVFDYIRVSRMVKRSHIGTDSRIINLRNGLLNIDTMEFTEHTDGHYSTVQYPIDYNTDAKCPAIEKFINEVVLPGDVNTLLEYTGYSLIPGNSMKVLAMLYGGRDAGKSTYCRLIESLVCASNVAHVSPQSIQEDRFAKARLYGKVLNTVPDIGDKPLSGTEAIKSLVGNDEISADQKYKNPINFVNKSHIFWGANSVPDIKNDDVDFYNKVLMVNFPNTFTGSKRDPDLIRRLTDPTELSGFFNMLIDARKRLMERGEFVESVTGADSRGRYRRLSNPIASFLEDHVVSSVDNIQKNTLHMHYVNWCSDNGVRHVAENVFGKKLKGLGYEDTQIRNGDDRTRVWLNIAYVDRKPTVQTTLNVTRVTCLSRVNGEASDMDTGEEENENMSLSQVSHVISLKDSIENKDIVYRDGNAQKPEYPVTSQPMAVNSAVLRVEPVTTSQPVTTHKTLRQDLINFIKVMHPSLVVDDIPSAVEVFCMRWPGYRANPGPEYVCKLAEILQSRGWK